MTSKDFRIGNLVLFGTTVAKIEAIFEDGIVVIHSDKCDSITLTLQGINPIPLTEEWLFKLGLRKAKDSTTFEWKDGDYRSVQVYLKPIEVEIYLCGCDSVMTSQCFPIDHIQYVHELQNICFALKGKELNLKQT